MSNAIRSLTFEGLIALARKTAQALPPPAKAVVVELIDRAKMISNMLCETEDAIAERAEDLANHRVNHRVMELHTRIADAEEDLAVVSAERDELRGVVSGARLAYLHMKHPASCPANKHSGCYEHEEGWYCERGLPPHDCHMESSEAWTACRCGVADMGEALGIESPRG